MTASHPGTRDNYSLAGGGSPVIAATHHPVVKIAPELRPSIDNVAESRLALARGELVHPLAESWLSHPSTTTPKRLNLPRRRPDFGKEGT